MIIKSSKKKIILNAEETDEKNDQGKVDAAVGEFKNTRWWRCFFKRYAPKELHTQESTANKPPRSGFKYAPNESTVESTAPRSGFKKSRFNQAT